MGRVEHGLSESLVKFWLSLVIEMEKIVVVHNSTGQNSTVHYSAEQCSTEQYSTVQNIIAQYRTILNRTVQNSGCSLLLGGDSWVTQNIL